MAIASTYLTFLGGPGVFCTFLKYTYVAATPPPAKDQIPVPTSSISPS